MLKNVLIVVDDIEKSIEFYKDLFGLQVILQNEGNVILSEGLVLQDADVWGKTLNADKHSPASSARSTKRRVRGMLMSVGVESSH